MFREIKFISLTWDSAWSQNRARPSLPCVFWHWSAWAEEPLWLCISPLTSDGAYRKNMRADVITTNDYAKIFLYLALQCRSPLICHRYAVSQEGLLQVSQNKFILWAICSFLGCKSGTAVGCSRFYQHCCSFKFKASGRFSLMADTKHQMGQTPSCICSDNLYADLVTLCNWVVYLRLFLCHHHTAVLTHLLQNYGAKIL